MDWVIFLLLASGALYVCAFIVRIRKNRDERALEKEVEQDFAEEFQFDQHGELTDKGMEDMMDWLEEQDEGDRMEGLEELREPGDSQSPGN